MAFSRRRLLTGNLGSRRAIDTALHRNSRSATYSTALHLDSRSAMDTALVQDLDSRSAVVPALHLDDSRSAIDTALHSCDMSFPVSLFRSKKSGQVLYVEAGKDFVDTLLSFLLLPVGTILHMLTSTGVPPEKPNSAISSIFKSVDKLDSELLHVERNCILAQPRPAVNNPSGLSKASTSTGLLHLCQDADAKRPSPPKKKLVLSLEQFYECNNCYTLSSAIGARCFTCWPENGPYKINSFFERGPYSFSAEEVRGLDDFVSEQQPVEVCNRATGPGFVKENITFMVTDKLEIMPSTTIEIMSLLKEMKVNSLADLESKKITVTITQVQQLLGSALTSNNCLNDVFGTEETDRIAGKISTLAIYDVAKVREALIPCDEQ